MKRRTALIVVLAAALAAVGGCATMAERYFTQKALTTGPNGPETPASLGAPYQHVSIPSHSRRLDAYLVRAPADCADPPVLLIYHGFEETISYWAGAQAFLYQHCVSSLVFDPTGSGDSSRPASVGSIGEDAGAAYAFARAQFGGGRRLFLLGHSMGNAILLQAEPGLSPAPSGVIVANGFSSLRELWAAHGGNRLVLRAVPDVWDNVRAVQAVHVPVLVIHSDTDKTVPVTQARLVYDAALQPKSLSIVHGFAHNGLRRRPSESWWNPVFAFIHSPGLSKTTLTPPISASAARRAANEIETAREEQAREDALALTAAGRAEQLPGAGGAQP